MAPNSTTTTDSQQGPNGISAGSPRASASNGSDQELFIATAVPQEFMISEQKKRFDRTVLTCYEAVCEKQNHYTAEPSAYYSPAAVMPVHSSLSDPETGAGDRRRSEGAHLQCMEPRGGDGLLPDQPRLEPERRI